MKKLLALMLVAVCCISLCSCLTLVSTKSMMSAREEAFSNMESETEEEYENEYDEPAIEPEYDEPEVYFEGFDVTLAEGEYASPATLSFTGNEGGTVYYAFADGKLMTDGEPTGILWDGNDISLPAGTFTLRAMCIDAEGNSKTILRSYTVNRLAAHTGYEHVAQNGYFDYVVIKDENDKVFVYDRFTGEHLETKKFPITKSISHIIAESRVRSTRDEMGADLYDKIIATAPAGAVGSIKETVVKDELVVYVSNYDALEGIRYTYIDGIADEEETEYAIILPDKDTYAIPEQYRVIATEKGELLASAVIGNYIFCRDTKAEKDYVHDLNTGETVEDVFLAERWTVLKGTTSNAVYYQYVDDGEYNCRRVDYDEIGSVFFGR